MMMAPRRRLRVRTVDRRRLDLHEDQRHPAVPLNVTEIAVLQRLCPSLRIAPSFEMPGHYDLTPQSVVGTLATETLHVVIHPKVKVGRLMFLLSYCIDPKHWR